jgi:hypothetical protein
VPDTITGLTDDDIVTSWGAPTNGGGDDDATDTAADDDATDTAADDDATDTEADADQSDS